MKISANHIATKITTIAVAITALTAAVNELAQSAIAKRVESTVVAITTGPPAPSPLINQMFEELMRCKAECDSLKGKLR